MWATPTHTPSPPLARHQLPPRTHTAAPSPGQAVPIPTLLMHAAFTDASGAGIAVEWAGEAGMVQVHDIQYGVFANDPDYSTHVQYYKHYLARAEELGADVARLMWPGGFAAAGGEADGAAVAQQAARTGGEDGAQGDGAAMAADEEAGPEAAQPGSTCQGGGSAAEAALLPARLQNSVTRFIRLAMLSGLVAGEGYGEASHKSSPDHYGSGVAAAVMADSLISSVALAGRYPHNLGGYTAQGEMTIWCVRGVGGGAGGEGWGWGHIDVDRRTLHAHSPSNPCRLPALPPSPGAPQTQAHAARAHPGQRLPSHQHRIQSYVPPHRLGCRTGAPATRPGYPPTP